MSIRFAALPTQLFVVLGDGVGEALDDRSQVRNFGSEAGECAGVGLSSAVFIDDGAYFGVAV
ncbi:hypothetical protein, partial [Gordonia aquimaris]